MRVCKIISKSCYVSKTHLNQCNLIGLHTWPITIDVFKQLIIILDVTPYLYMYLV